MGEAESWVFRSHRTHFIFSNSWPNSGNCFSQPKSQLKARNNENNRLIERSEIALHESKEQITELQRKLEVWEGKSNPWPFWPPKSSESPRTGLIEDAFEQSTAALSGPLKDGKYRRDETARGYSGLAMLADAAGKSPMRRTSSACTLINGFEPNNQTKWSGAGLGRMRLAVSPPHQGERSGIGERLLEKRTDDLSIIGGSTRCRSDV